jgi:hypothetical protein
VPYCYIPPPGVGASSLFYGHAGYPFYSFGGYSYAYGRSTFYEDTFGSSATETGGVRLKIKPKEAQVYVDGSYAGIVDDFNGHFQHLDLTPGPHHISVQAPGYAPLEFDVTIQPHTTITLSGTAPPGALAIKP